MIIESWKWSWFHQTRPINHSIDCVQVESSHFLLDSTMQHKIFSSYVNSAILHQTWKKNHSVDVMTISVQHFLATQKLKSLPRVVFEITIWVSWYTGAYSQCIPIYRCRPSKECFFETLLFNAFESSATHLVFDDFDALFDSSIDASSETRRHETKRFEWLAHLVMVALGESNIRLKSMFISISDMQM